jgi:hypothetical protein
MTVGVAPIDPNVRTKAKESARAKEQQSYGKAMRVKRKKISIQR